MTMFFVTILIAAALLILARINPVPLPWKGDERGPRS